MKRARINNTNRAATIAARVFRTHWMDDEVTEAHHVVSTRQGEATTRTPNVTHRHVAMELR